MQALVNNLFSGAPALRLIAIDEITYTVPGSGSGDFTDASNTAAQAFNAVIRGITNASAITSFYSVWAANSSLISTDGIHPSTTPAPDGQHPGTGAGYDALAAIETNQLQPLLANLPSSQPGPPADPYRSDNATPVTILADYKPGAPNPFAGVGLGTFLLPTVVLNWINPANLLGGTIHIMRMNAGTSDPFVVVGTVTGADANTAPAQTYTDTTVLNGHRYTYTAFATPYGDTTTP